MIRIVTDTTAGLPRELTSTLDIPVLPQIVVIGEKSFRDDTGLDTVSFLELLRKSPQLPKTSAPPPALLTQLLKQPYKMVTPCSFCIRPPKLAGQYVQPKLPPKITPLQISELSIPKLLPATLEVWFCWQING